MKPVSAHMLRRIVSLITVIFLAAGCSGGSGGGGSEGSPGDTTNPLGISITSPGSAITVAAGDSVEFKGSVSEGTSPYNFQWNFGNAARNYQSQGTTPPTQVITFGATGTYNVSLTATDDSGVSGNDSVTITVVDYVDTKPTVSILSPSPDPATIQRGDSLAFVLQVRGGNSPFTFHLDFPDQIARDYHVENAVNPPSPNITFNTAGTFEVNFTATDADNDQSSDSITIIVQ
ncbi:MAG TPA: PKD domain-containing protein [Deltaproteobacteria bacterium]|nr:PKD domain-containing protein [Deltaproteobacteria bacterium]